MASVGYFENISYIIQGEILQATTRIRVAVAWLTDDSIIKSLEGAAGKGVLIEILFLNDEINKASSLLTNQIISKYCHVYMVDENKNLMHNKFAVIDDKIVITGSYNWSVKAKTNLENIVVIKKEQDLVDSYIREFEKIKNENKNGLLNKNLKFTDLLEIDILKTLAQEALIQEDYQKSVIYFTALILRIPKEKELYERLYNCQVKLKNYNAALETWRKYIAIYSEDSEAYDKLYQINSLLGNKEQALIDISEAILKCKDKSNKAYLRLKRANLRLSLTWFSSGYPSIFKSHIKLIVANSKEKDIEKKMLALVKGAEEDYDYGLKNAKFLSKDYEFIVKLNFAEVKFYLGQSNEATNYLIEFYNKVKSNPTIDIIDQIYLVRSLEILARMYKVMEEYLLAAKTFKRLKNDFPNSFSCNSEYLEVKSKAGFMGNFI